VAQDFGEATLRFRPGDKHGSIPPCNPVPLSATRAQLVVYLDREVASAFGQVMPLILVGHTQSNCSQVIHMVHQILIRLLGGENCTKAQPPLAVQRPRQTRISQLTMTGPWYMGKAREEFNRLVRDAAAMMKTPYRYVQRV